MTVIETTDEAQIRALFATRTRALRQRDATAAAADYDTELVLFDAVAPFVRRGDNPVERLQSWLDSYHGGVGHEVHDLQITAGADVAYCHFLVRITGTMSDGHSVDMWVRATSGLRRGPAGWRIVHEHASVPFDAATGRAVLTDRYPAAQ